MRLTNKQIQFIINCDIEELVSLLQKDYNFSIIEAFDTVYNSNLYKTLINTGNGMYIQSPLYQYEYLKKELSSQNKI